MKKLFIIIAMYSTFTFGQSLNILAVNPTIVCPGDSITVCYQIHPDPKQFINMHIDIQGTVLHQQWQYDSLWWASWPNTIYLGQKLYCARLRVSPELPQGQVTIYSAPHPQTTPLTLNCTFTSLNDIAPNTAPRTYYDIYGNQTQKKEGEIIIERTGTHYRKYMIR